MLLWIANCRRLSNCFLFNWISYSITLFSSFRILMSLCIYDLSCCKSSFCSNLLLRQLAAYPRFFSVLLLCFILWISTLLKPDDFSSRLRSRTVSDTKSSSLNSPWKPPPKSEQSMLGFLNDVFGRNQLLQITTQICLKYLCWNLKYLSANLKLI